MIIMAVISFVAVTPIAGWISLVIAVIGWEKRLGTYFANYENPAYTCRDKAKVEKLLFRSQSKEVEIAVSEIFLGQPFTNELVATIYQDIREYIPHPYNKWKIVITVNGYPIERAFPFSVFASK